MNELKPCPFCGSDDVLPIYATYAGKGEPNHFVQCYGCDVFGPSAYSLEEAIEKWNKRVELARAVSDFVTVLNKAMDVASPPTEKA